MADWVEPFKVLSGKTHTQQAIWWLNGFWKSGASDYAEEVWTQAHLLIELEAGRPKMYGSKTWEVKEGCDVDEFKAHNFIEKLAETMTVMALRKKLKDLDIDNNKKMSLSEYLLGKHSKTPTELVNAPQGGQADQDLLDKAKASVDAASSALSSAVEEEELSTAAAAAAAAALAASEAAAAELAAAVAALAAEEQALADKKAGFQAKIDDENISAMKKSMAKNELAQLESEDPLPLRKAQITQKASLKRAEKAKKLAEAEKDKADAAADAAKKALEEANQAFADAQAALDELKSKGDGIAQGAIWWMDRELEERRKYMPRGKK